MFIGMGWRKYPSLWISQWWRCLGGGIFDELGPQTKHSNAKEDDEELTCEDEENGGDGEGLIMEDKAMHYSETFLMLWNYLKVYAI